MPSKLEPWWVCSECAKPLVRVRKSFDAAIRKHRLVCTATSGGVIRQVDQRKVVDLKKP